MRYIEVPKGLIEKTKAMIRFYLFLRYDCGLKEADKLSAKELRRLLCVVRKKG